MKLTRRDALALGLGATAASFLPSAAKTANARAIEAFTGGARPGHGGLTVTVPRFSRSGRSVLVTVNAPGAVAIIVLATGNPVPHVATFEFGPAAGASTASIRVRLSASQDIVAVAKMSDGRFVQASSNVNLTGDG